MKRIMTIIEKIIAIPANGKAIIRLTWVVISEFEEVPVSSETVMV